MPDLPVVPPLDLAARLDRIEARLAALEANLTQVADDQPDPVELGRVRWFMKHGRRRPW